MNMLRQLSQSSLATRTLRTTPTLYSSGRIVGVHLLRQYATATAQKSGSEPTKKSSKKSQRRTKENIINSDIPQEPKKPATAYNLFFREFYREKHQVNPAFKVTDIAKLAGAQWSKLTAEDKKKYVELYKKSASDYEKSHKEWLESLTSQQIAEENIRRRQESKTGRKKKKVLKLIKDPRMPKKPRTPYINYVTEHMQSDVGGDWRGKERVKELAYDWKNVLTPEDKKPYEEAYQKDKLRYEKEMEAFKNQV